MAFQHLRINTSISYDPSYPNPNYITERSTFRGGKQQVNDTGVEVMPVNVDFGFDFHEQELREYFIRMKQLANHGPFIGIHCYEYNQKTKTGYIVLDQYGYCFQDLLNRQNGPESFFIQNPRSGKFNFSQRFQKMLRVIIEGIKIILAEYLDYPYLSTKSIVFSVGDHNFAQPILVDIYAGAEPSSVWRNLADVIRIAICSCGAARERTSDDINQFLNVLDTYPMNCEGKIIQHPALLFRGERLQRIVHIFDNDQANEVRMIPNYDFWDEVSNNGPWKYVFGGDPYWETMEKKNNYGSSAQDLVRLVRNMDQHLSYNIQYDLHPNHPNLRQLSREEIEELFESYFPRFLSYLFDVLSDGQWVKKG